MPRESTIQVYRSSVTDIATGLTFGELAYTDVNGKLFVGRTGGAALWVGAGITTGDITNNSSVLVPTQSAVKAYVDGTVGGGSVVNTVNGTGGAITVTGDSGSVLAIVSGKTTTFSNRLATTSLTGVASFNSTYFSVASGAVSLASAYQVTGDTAVAGTAITVSRSGNAATINNNGVVSANGGTGALTITGDGASQLVTVSGTTTTFSNRLASTSATGVASFNNTDFTVSAAGAVTLNTLKTFLTFRDGFNTSYSSVASDTFTLTGGSGIEVQNTSSRTFSFRGITASTTTIGVASYNPTYFSVSSGAVSLASAYQVTGDTAVAGTAITVSRSGNAATINNNGVVSFNGATGAVTLTGAGAITYTQSGTSNTINARLATSSLTGVASFNSASFDVSAGGDVTVKSAGISNAQLANSSVTVAAGGSSTLSLGNTLTLTGGASPNIIFSNTSNTITATLANDVTIAGNLTVNGTVTTVNVNDFIVEDPLIALGTGNAADSVDLGWYGIYTSTGLRYAGSFRDASDGKFKFFTGLTAQPTTTIDTAAATYVTATIVANIDGGTF